jgi:hypothetical protein
LAAQLEDERDLYAVRPSLSSVVAELIVVAFRRMHRSPPKPKRVPRSSSPAGL